MLEEIKKKVQRIANNSNKKIIVGVYQNMIIAHNDFCDCNYCNILKNYVQMKKYLSANFRRMNSYDYDYYNNENVIKDLDDLVKIKLKISELKKQKNSLKKIC